MALQIAPRRKLIEVRKAIDSGPKNSLSFDFAGMSLPAYRKNMPIEVKKAYLNIEPYYVTKKPSEPSLIISAISCIDLGPTSFYRISQRIHKLTNTKKIDIFQAVNEIKLEVDCETNM